MTPQTQARTADEIHELGLPQGTVPLEIFTPRAPGPHPAVVVLHEIFGLNDDIRRIAARFAAHGYVAAAPNLFASGTWIGCFARSMQALRSGTGPLVETLDAIVEVVETRPDTGKVGVVGFCMGGGFAILLGARERVAAAGVFYGDPRPRAELGRVCPLTGGYGGQDRMFAAKGRALIADLDALGKEHDIRIYDDAGHSYMSDAGHPLLAWLTRPLMHVEYNDAAAEDSWRRMLAFFGRHLASTGN